ncbi:MAG: YdeI/OmpD-associated family protein [Deltaproteobacteria bacterium]|nr:YdeI/OmpD-associated family protein [Deltaproteobacteria bacterium]
MNEKQISQGVVHAVPTDMRNAIISDGAVLKQWEDITPLARNEWICWVEDAKKAETRQKRIRRLCEDLKKNKRRPCCWPGCSHR